MKTKEELYSEVQECFKKIEKGSGISNAEGMITRAGKRWVMFDTTYLPFDILREMDALLGPVSHTIIYRMGDRCGRAIFDKYKTLGFDGDTCLKFATVGAWYFGWGLVDFEIKENYAKVRIYNSFEAESNIANQGIDPRNSCDFLKGIFAGVWNRYSGKNWHVTETKCKARGDGHCELIIKPA